ncbi:MHS family MFS transporter (plasmid) [Rhizobium sp. CB3060]|uniref:MFS transporter n=1 Tax=Rhizobium sp. CB3060 TaxID=3138255 RepID=UPI0021A71AD3|nr:MFS transporter [Rhizobium tropici]UWU25208.1 MHS family MFS transporter [Rhizobium tropici]
MSNIGLEEQANSAMMRRVAIASCIGTTVEWYDFFIYATASALVFNKLFFPSFDPLVGSLVALGTYAAGFFVRPIGGLLFGYLGDRYGRKSALVTTLLIVGIATFVIGLMPTYESIGIAAPLILLFIRMLHGFGIGGEQGNAILIMCEHAPAKRRGYFGSWVQTGAPAGFILPLGIFAALTATLSEEAFMSWGWRIPFLLSLVLVAVGMYIRLQLTESPLFLEMRRRRAEDPHPLVEIVRKYPRYLALGCGTKFAESVAFTSFAVLITAYATSRGVSRPVMTTASLIAIVLELVCMPFWGALSDRIGRKPVYILGASTVLLASFPTFALVYYRVDSYIWVGLTSALAIGHSAMYGPQAAYFAEFFPTRVRASGVSFIQQIGALIGSVGTLAAGWLLALLNGAPWALAGFVALGCAITIACTAALPETAPRLGRWKDLVDSLTSGDNMETRRQRA